MQFLWLYLLAIPIFFAVDMVWLVLVARNFYRSQLGDLFTDNVIWPAAIAFYLIFIVGVVFFAVQPALDDKSLWTAISHGALLGFVAYCTYDLTNLATTRGWPVTLTFVDIAWGTVLAATVSGLTYLAADALGI
jgi:uncharacterized membrane protein